ncbi:hypothetical protein FYJ34_07940 [Clostridiaceae bacterium 68-1-5]|uniref:Uncharacterized protein n=1 Tax=Suipraeoptans intestinalis TaxID=2606628 RepID=A0A6N7V224_9FIRM|nr:hypothetical protein [Suipraeoptans intestinalis]MSR94190.1 hypothetical protein [Suipraeoptans intestinalis]
MAGQDTKRRDQALKEPERTQEKLGNKPAGQETNRFKDVTNGFKKTEFSEKPIKLKGKSRKIFRQFSRCIEDCYKWRLSVEKINIKSTELPRIMDKNDTKCQISRRLQDEDGSNTDQPPSGTERSRKKLQGGVLLL